MGDEYKFELETNNNLNHQHHHHHHHHHHHRHHRDVSDSSSTTSTTTTTARGQQLDSSNFGFQLLKKHGWTEGTGLGLSQQGRLEPIEAYVKKNKKGLGAEKLKNKTLQSVATPTTKEKTEIKSKKEKALSKRLRKMLAEDKRQQEKEFQRAFFREFWPDNV